MPRVHRLSRVDHIARYGAVVGIFVGMWVLSVRFHLGDNTFLAFAYAGALLLHLFRRPRWGECLATLGCAVVLAACYLAPHLPVGDFFGAPVVAALAFLGQGSLLVLTVRALWSDERERQQSYLETLRPAVLLATFVILASLGLEVTSRVHQKTLDLFLYAFDGALGFPGGPLGRLFQDWTFLQNLGFVVYEALPLEIALLYAVQARHSPAVSADILKLFVGAGAGGFLLYQVFPACGPLYVFRMAFPGQLPAASSLAIQPVALADAPRNAIPSLHAAWTLLLWWNSRGLARWVRGINAFVCIMTLLVTVGSGEHYLVDLIVAVPFSLAVQAACSGSFACRSPERVHALVAGAALTGLWLAGLRFGVPYFQAARPLAWSFTAATLAACWVLGRRLVQRPRHEVERLPLGAADVKSESPA